MYKATTIKSPVIVISRYLGFKPTTATRKSPPVLKNTPVFKSPPITIISPVAHLTLGLYFFSKNSGRVIAFASLKGLIQNPVFPTRYIDVQRRSPTTAPEKPYL